MGFFDRFKERKDLAPGERQILELLTAGGPPEFARLRTQWSEPFGMWIERRRFRNTYSVDLIHDSNVADEHSIGITRQFRIDDLVVIDRRLRTPIACAGPVHDGLLCNIICTTPESVRWPKYLNVDDWFYIDGEGRQTKSRRPDWTDRITMFHAAPRIDPEIDRLVAPDYRDYITGRGAEREVGDITLLPLAQLYLLDHPDVAGRFIVFGSASDASVVAFAISDDDKVQGIYFINVSDARPERVAATFAQWLSECSQSDD